jgi:hypothetical protein
MQASELDVLRTEQSKITIMSNKRCTTLRETVVTEISQDRRNKRRYALELPVQYKIVKNYLVVGSGSGHSLNLSSNGIAFAGSQPLKVGSVLELSVSWPVLLNQSCPLKLVAFGRVVRSDHQCTAISMDRYEFRTQGVKSAQEATSLATIEMAFR